MKVPITDQTLIKKIIDQVESFIFFLVDRETPENKVVLLKQSFSSIV